nr:hypothetical protein BaRGS_014338 [Batillaria attramentaria]
MRMTKAMTIEDDADDHNDDANRYETPPEHSAQQAAENGFNGQRIDNQLARSQMDCADQCLRTMDCKAVNVFPYDDESGLTNCSLIGVHSPGICDGLSEAASESS